MKRIKTIALLVLIGLFLLPSWSFADGDSDGNKLLSDCGQLIMLLDGQSVDQSGSEGIAFCLGLLQGLLHMNQLYEHHLKGAALFCSPTGTTTGQAARIVVKYLRDHPEELHKRNSVLAFIALRNAFPCTNKK